MRLRQIHENKKQYLSLLLLADEQESMIDRYLERGRLYVLESEAKEVRAQQTQSSGRAAESDRTEDSGKVRTAGNGIGIDQTACLPETICVCVLTEEGKGIAEVKNLAVAPDWQRRGCGRYMLAQIEAICRSEGYAILQVGTGDSPLTIPFYEACGFHKFHVVRNFFVDNYERPVMECGKQLVDMIYLQKALGRES